MPSTSDTTPQGFSLPHVPATVEHVLDTGLAHMEFTVDDLKAEVGVSDPMTKLEWDKEQYHSSTVDNWLSVEAELDYLMPPTSVVAGNNVTVVEVSKHVYQVSATGSAIIGDYPSQGFGVNIPTGVWAGAGQIGVNGNPVVSGWAFAIQAPAALTGSVNVYAVPLNNPNNYFPLPAVPTALVAIGGTSNLWGIDAAGALYQYVTTYSSPAAVQAGTWNKVGSIGNGFPAGGYAICEALGNLWVLDCVSSAVTYEIRKLNVSSGAFISASATQTLPAGYLFSAVGNSPLVATASLTSIGNQSVVISGIAYPDSQPITHIYACVYNTVANTFNLVASELTQSLLGSVFRNANVIGPAAIGSDGSTYYLVFGQQGSSDTLESFYFVRLTEAGGVAAVGQIIQPTFNLGLGAPHNTFNAYAYQGLIVYIGPAYGGLVNVWAYNPGAETINVNGTTYSVAFAPPPPNGLYSAASGAPVNAPPQYEIFYLRLDTPTVANQRIYVWNGTAWTGIL